MSFSSGVRKWAADVPTKIDSVFDAVVKEAHRSIQTGSEITAAPGQPVKSGELRDSWIVSHPEPGVASISTTKPYGPAIEDGVGAHGPLTLRSKVGGFHSVKLTVAGFPKIVEHAARSVAP